MTRRPWTAQDQKIAELMRAEGATYAAIGLVIDRSASVVRCHLDPIAAERQIKSRRKWVARNPDKMNLCRARYAENNPQKIIESKRKWRQENPEKQRESQQRYYEKNIDKVRAICRESQRKYYRANPDKARESSRRYRDANRQKVLDTGRLWRSRNAEKVREKARRRRSLQRASQRRSLVSITFATKTARFAIWHNRCGFCGVDANHRRNNGYEKLTVEHALALINGGLDEASNILPACSTCNSSKSDAPIEEWYRRQPFFTEARWRKICRHCPGAVIGQLPLAMPPTDTEAA
jgi:hypothetical protein